MSAIQRLESNGPEEPAALPQEPAFSREDLQSAVAAHLRDSGRLASIIANSTTSRSVSQSQVMTTMSKRLVPVTGWTAANPEDRRELVLEDRTMQALQDEFAIVFEDLLTDSKTVKVRC